MKNVMWLQCQFVVFQFEMSLQCNVCDRHKVLGTGRRCRTREAFSQEYTLTLLSFGNNRGRHISLLLNMFNTSLSSLLFCLHPVENILFGCETNFSIYGHLFIWTYLCHPACKKQPTVLAGRHKKLPIVGEIHPRLTFDVKNCLAPIKHPHLEKFNNKFHIVCLFHDYIMITSWLHRGSSTYLTIFQ